MPREFTKLDEIIDLVFAATEDVRQDPSQEVGAPYAESAAQAPGTEPPVSAEPPLKQPKFRPVAFHDACVARIQAHLGRTLVKRSRATFASVDGHLMVICAVSREHWLHDAPTYWFAFHPHQKDILAGATEAYVAFGCGSEATTLLIPFADFVSWLDGLWTTDRDDRFYWHVHVVRHSDGRFVLDRRRGCEPIDLTRYLLRDEA